MGGDLLPGQGLPRRHKRLVVLPHHHEVVTVRLLLLCCRMLLLNLSICVRVYDSWLSIAGWSGLLLQLKCLSLLRWAMLNHSHFTIQWTAFSVSLTKLSHLILATFNLLSWLWCIVVRSRGIIMFINLVTLLWWLRMRIILHSDPVIVLAILVFSERGSTTLMRNSLFVAIKSCLSQVLP